MKKDKRYLKDEYVELRNNCPDVRGNKAVYTAEMILKLKEMAGWNVVPDVRFSDEEVELWSKFKVYVV